MPTNYGRSPAERQLRTAAYVRFSSAATRLGLADRAARLDPSSTTAVQRADALTSLRDTRIAFIAACGGPVDAIDPRCDLLAANDEDERTAAERAEAAAELDPAAEAASRQWVAAAAAAAEEHADDWGLIPATDQAERDADDWVLES